MPPPASAAKVPSDRSGALGRPSPHACVRSAMWRGDSPAPTSRFRNEGLRSPLCMTICFIMTDIEALLSVDAGQVPEGTVAFFTRDPERGQRRLYLVTGALLLLGAVA